MHYKNNKIITVKQLVLHSVGTPQPSPSVFYKIWNTTTNKYLAHIILGASTAYECLPCMEIKGKAVFCYHVGNANSYSIGVEMTEPSTIKYTSGANWVDNNPTKTRAHVMATYNNAVDIFAQLCKFHELNPLENGVILSHSECYRRGVGTNHADVEHIWNKFGLTMNKFREDVNSAMLSNTDKAPINPIDSYDVGDILEFTGDTHYPNANARIGSRVNPNRVKVTATSKNAKHPYHVRSVNNAGDFIPGVYGWVDEKYLKELPNESFLVKVTADILNIRRGPSTLYSVVGDIRDKGVYTIVEVDGSWGKLSSKLGWIHLGYTKKL